MMGVKSIFGTIGAGLILLALILWGVNSCNKANAKENAEDAAVYAEAEKAPPVEVIMCDLSVATNNDIVIYLTTEYGTWRSSPYYDGEEENKTAVAVLEDMEGKIIVIDKSGKNIPCERVYPGCYRWRMPIYNPERGIKEYDPSKGEVQATGISITCAGCSLDACG